MAVTRRNFLGTLGAGAAAAGVLNLPFSEPFARALVPGDAGAAASGGPIILNSNENAYGPAPKVVAAMRRALGLANRYPDSSEEHFVERAALEHKVKPEQVLAGCGSGEILRTAALAYAAQGLRLVTAAPTFEALGFISKTYGGMVETVPLRADYAHDLDAMLARVKTTGGPPVGLVYVCNPNNPTASLTPRKDIEAFLAKLPGGVHVLIDEAYHHFATSAPEYVSFLDQPVDDARVIVTRTFSKVYGLAGLRLGYAVAQEPEIEQLKRHKLWNGANAVVSGCGVAALDDRAGMEILAARIGRDRFEFVRQAEKRRLATVPSHANFVMLDTRRPVRNVIRHFESHNILVGRPFPPMETHARISLGTPAEMEAFWEVWDQMPAATSQ